MVCRLGQHQGDSRTWRQWRSLFYVGAKQILAGSLTIGGFFTYTLSMKFLIAPIMQIVQIGTQITEALAGLERTHEILKEATEDSDPRRTVTPPAIVA